MSSGIVIHVSIGDEKRTELFTEKMICVGSDESNELRMQSSLIGEKGVWLKLEREDGVYRVVDFAYALNLAINNGKISRDQNLTDGDVVSFGSTGITLSFFPITSESSLVTTNHDPHVAPFIEDAALDAAATEKRDDAKAFLREFTRELLSEISLATKLIIGVLTVGVITGLLYFGYSYDRDARISRELVKSQSKTIDDLKGRIDETGIQIEKIDESNEKFQRMISLAPNLRLDYGNGVCLIVGVYDLVERKSGKILRYPDPASFKPDPFEPQRNVDGISEEYEEVDTSRLTTVGNGSPVEYDFIGTGFHVGGGFIVTNRHVIQPWSEDDLVKQLLRESNGRARIRRVKIYFPNKPTPFVLKVKKVSRRDDIAIATIDPKSVTDDIPVLPLETDSDSAAIGKAVVTIGYPNGPDRLIAMVDDDEARSINRRFGNSRQDLINYLARSLKIAPLTTQGTITDLDRRRVVHDAKTAEGGSGAPLFGQSGKVIGVNFGVFTQNNASNMAIPISFVVTLLKAAGWQLDTKGAELSNDSTQTAKVTPGDAKTAQSNSK